MNTTVKTAKAPAALGPYSQAVKAGTTLYLSGQLGIDPKTGEFAGDTIQSQTARSLENLAAVLAEAGYGFEDVVKCTVLLKNIDDFAAMNSVYEDYPKETRPARAAYAVADLPKGGLVEIEMIAVKQ